MEQPIFQLYPQPYAECMLKGLYLAHDVRQFANAASPYIYANFVTSLDGRIAIPRPDGSGLMVPKNITNGHDWRLYQELAAQADLIISSGRYLREWAQGRAQEILQTDDPRFADLREWRMSRGLKPQPDIAIISASLDFSIPDVLKHNGRKAVFFTTENPNPERVHEIEKREGKVVVAGKNRVEGKLLAQHAYELGYRVIYSGAGPKILYLLLKEGLLNRLYLTLAHRILSGNPFATIAEGPLLEPAINFQTNTLYLDKAGLNGMEQLFVSYNCV
ncbi:MAG: pyrimidine reductase [Candidatus Brocadia sp. UTAMX1]|jgi:riboflavin biosynthesis pyrimidine reductase|nr:MAG: pyrimidine reductase [Candidatus Brocadia sp. UTAMX1]